MRGMVLIAAGISLLAVIAGALPAAAQHAAPALEGVWTVKYADGSEESMTVEKESIKFGVPLVGELKGRVEIRSDYFESILDRRGGIDFMYGYLKSGGAEGKLQESLPCKELKKAFKSGVVESSSTCQVAFTAVRK